MVKTFWVGCPLSISSTTVWFNFGVTVSSFSQFPGLLVFCFCTPTIIAHVPSNLFPRSLYFSKHQANPPLSILFILATSLLHPRSILAPAYCNNEQTEPINTDTDTGLRTSDQLRRVGGTCVHRSRRSTEDTEQPPISTEAFCQEMISRYGSSSNSRGRKKRQAADEWTSCPVLAQRHTSVLFRCDEESRLRHLETQFGGNVDAAELDMRVRLSNGTGEYVAPEGNGLSWHESSILIYT